MFKYFGECCEFLNMKKRPHVTNYKNALKYCEDDIKAYYVMNHAVKQVKKSLHQIFPHYRQYMVDNVMEHRNMVIIEHEKSSVLNFTQRLISSSLDDLMYSFKSKFGVTFEPGCAWELKKYGVNRSGNRHNCRNPPVVPSIPQPFPVGPLSGPVPSGPHDISSMVHFPYHNRQFLNPPYHYMPMHSNEPPPPVGGRNAPAIDMLRTVSTSVHSPTASNFASTPVTQSIILTTPATPALATRPGLNAINHDNTPPGLARGASALPANTSLVSPQVDAMVDAMTLEKSKLDERVKAQSIMVAPIAAALSVSAVLALELPAELVAPIAVPASIAAVEASTEVAATNTVTAAATAEATPVEVTAEARTAAMAEATAAAIAATAAVEARAEAAIAAAAVSAAATAEAMAATVAAANLAATAEATAATVAAANLAATAEATAALAAATATAAAQSEVVVEVSAAGKKKAQSRKKKVTTANRTTNKKKINSCVPAKTKQLLVPAQKKQKLGTYIYCLNHANHPDKVSDYGCLREERALVHDGINLETAICNNPSASCCLPKKGSWSKGLKKPPLYLCRHCIALKGTTAKKDYKIPFFMCKPCYDDMEIGAHPKLPKLGSRVRKAKKPADH